MCKEVKSLRWLANMFPYIEKPKDDTEKMNNAIHVYATRGADKIEQLEEDISIESKIEEKRYISLLFK